MVVTPPKSWTGLRPNLKDAEDFTNKCRGVLVEIGFISLDFHGVLP
jgi:hypothetical protein